jgi:hypothetical protein
MLVIYENIERCLKTPKSLEEFDDLFKRDIQKPVLLTPPSAEEQVKFPIKTKKSLC